MSLEVMTINEIEQVGGAGFWSNLFSPFAFGIRGILYSPPVGVGSNIVPPFQFNTNPIHINNSSITWS